MRKDEEGHFILISEIIHQEDIIILNRHVPDTGATNFRKQILVDVKAEITPEKQ